MKKSALCLILSLVMVFTASPAALAESSPSFSAQPTAAEKAAIIDDLRDIDPMKDMFGFENIEFSDIFVGNKIHRYNYIDNTFVDSGIAFPLFYNGELFALALYVDATGHYQIGPSLVTEINDAAIANLALVYDYDSCYLYDGAEFIHVITTAMKIDDRDVLSEDLANSTVTATGIILCNLSVSEKLAYTPGPSVVVNPPPANADRTTEAEENNTDTTIYWIAAAACAAAIGVYVFLRFKKKR